jgi:hypothetical protein
MKKKCDEGRPCKRCVRRGLQEECRDRNGDGYHFHSDDFYTTPLPVDYLAILSIPAEYKSSSDSASSSAMSTSSDDESISEKSGFWSQFATGLSEKSVQSVLSWFQRYSPMYLHEMIEANSISRRKYLNLCWTVSSVEAMQTVNSEMMTIAAEAAGVDPDEFKRKHWKQMGVPYVGIKVFSHALETKYLSPEFCKAVFQAWPELNSFEQLISTVALVQVHLVECVDDNGGSYCRISFQVNPYFEYTMKTNAVTTQRYLTEGTRAKIKTGHPCCWIFHDMHWELLMDFVCYGFFNERNFMQGTFALANWNHQARPFVKLSPDLANVVAHSCYDETYSHVCYTFAFRKI